MAMATRVVGEEEGLVGKGDGDGRLVLVLAGALFYATVTFRFFLFFSSVQKYSILSTTLTIMQATCTLVRKKGVFPPLKTKAKPNCTPPFLLPLTHPLCMAVCERCSG